MGLRELFLSLSRITKSMNEGKLNDKVIVNSSTSCSPSEYTIERDRISRKVNNRNLEPTLKPRKNIKNRYILQVCVLLGAIITLFIINFTTLQPFEGADISQCRSIYMFPSYGRVDGFDLRYTPLAKKYHLYLYREQGLDMEPLVDGKIQLNGIPVIFIPGNAGSFKQVRSIAASCSRKYFEDSDDIENAHSKNLDFFTADFNEDFTAFHGRTMLDQAEYLNDAIRYILSLYEQSTVSYGPKPSSVIVIGHSMGGIVARILPTLKNHVEGSIQSLITLSSPHAAAPVTFDGDILKIYARTNDYWRAQMQDRESFFSQNVSLVSITGGILDMMLPADYTAVEDILPLENGFTTYSTTIPGVWTAIDHLAVVWCDQLRKIMATLLLESVDFRNPSKVLSLNDRMRVSRKFLLSGFENYTQQDVSEIQVPFPLSVHHLQTLGVSQISRAANKIVILPENLNDVPAHTKILFPKDKTGLKLDMLLSNNDIVLYLCKNGDNFDPSNIKSMLDDTCYLVNNHIKTVPASLKSTKYASDSSIENEIKPFKMMTLDSEVFNDYDYLLLEKSSKVDMKPSGFIIGQLSSEKPQYTSKITPFHVALFGFEFDTSNDMLQTVSFPNLWDSLLSYKIKVRTITEASKVYPFEPFVRQWIEDPFESKWHVNISMSDFNVNMHNVAPFIPLEETHDKSLKLTCVIPPDMKLRFELRINWGLTIKMLFIRYRLTLLSFPISVVCLVMTYQCYYCQKTDTFLGFKEALAKLLKRYGTYWFILLLGLNPIVNTRAVQSILYFFDPIRLNRPFLLDELQMHTNLYFLGIRSWSLSGLAIIFALISITALYAIAVLYDIIEKATTFLSKSRLCSPYSQELSQRGGIAHRPWKIRGFACLMLICAVLLYIPYQLASAISLIIQIATCLRVMLNSKNFTPSEYHNLRNYNFSVFLLLLFVVLINSPIMIVFFHNVAIRWETPFRSHHNFLAIAPIILLVNFNSGLKMPDFKCKRIYECNVTCALLLYISFFGLLYGSRNLYWIHHLVNILCAWFLYRAYTGNQNIM